MIQWAVMLAMMVSAPIPDHSKGYFGGLSRDSVSEMKWAETSGPVILIVVDAMRPDRLGAYGFKRATSPQLDRLADDGVILTNYFVNGNWTRPTTASILTGELPSEHGVQQQRSRLPAEALTFPSVLQGAGIPTGAVVGNGNAGSAFGLDRGFDYYADTVKHWKGLPNAQEVVDLAVPFVEKNKTRPFFLMLFMVDPHDPYHAPGEFETMFVEDPSVKLLRTPHWELGKYSPATVKRMLATYDGAVRYTDTVLGKFFDQLRAMGVYDKATIMVTSDHGEAFGEHGVFLHSHHLYDEIIRAPMIIRAPGMGRRGGYNHYLFDSTDLAPTIVARFGVTPPNQWRGVDLVEHLRKPGLNKTDRATISEFNHFGIRRRAIRTYRHKLIFQEPADREEFAATVGKPSLLPSVSFTREVIRYFDLMADPREQRALSQPPPGAQGLLKTLKKGAAGKTRGPELKTKDLDAETVRDLKTMGYIR
jgi:arylsulfatase A-like enzyme